MSAAVVRWQIVTPRPGELCDFYEKVFGWRISRDNPLGVREVRTHAAGAPAGSVWPAPPDAPTFVQLFLEVPDVAEAVAAVEGRGGSVIVPRSVLPQGEVMAIVRDPFGLSLGLMEPVAPSTEAT